MKTSFAHKLVADFWERVGYEEPFPRQLEGPIMAGSSVFVIKVPRQRLDTTYIRNKLQRRAVCIPTPWSDRRMHGCLVAFKGEAAIFVDGTLPAEETRVIMAHEFGHYLADYEWLRCRALRHLGDGIIEVLDGCRPALRNELLGAALTGTPIGAYVHFMDRCSNADVTSLVSQVEVTANIVGAELLAPRHAVLAELAREGCSSQTSTERLLQSQFGLPKTFAAWYAARIMRYLSRNRSFSDVLGLETTQTLS